MRQKDYVRHDPNSPDVRSLEDGQQLISMYLPALPHLHFTAEHLAAQGDMVLARLTAHVTHQGALMDITPSGKQSVVFGTDAERHRVSPGTAIRGSIRRRAFQKRRKT